jgi:hypothetical protein
MLRVAGRRRDEAASAAQAGFAFHVDEMMPFVLR